MSSEPATSPTHSAVTRASLLFRLRDWRDNPSWEEFYALYRKLVHGLATRSGLTPVEADEVTQDVFQRVAETIHQFEARGRKGSFRAWLMNLTRWRITDKLRERQRASRFHSAPRHEAAPNDATSTVDQVPDPAEGLASDEVWEGEWEQRVLEAAIGRLRERVDPRHFQVFELYVCQEKSVKEIARELDINRATIYVIHYRLRKLLIAEVKRLKDEFE